MTDLGVLKELLIVLTATIAIVFVFQKLRLPTVVGVLLAGVIVGPDGLGLVRDVHEIETLAEIGVVLLLFMIGVEFSLAEVLPIRRVIIWAGVLQITLTTLVVFVISLFFGAAIEVGIFYGFLVSLSSTAIVLKIYNDRKDIDTLQGRLATGILLFQDLCIIPMMLLVPILGRSGNASFPLIAWALIKAVLVLGVIVVGSRIVLPWFLRHVASLRNRELFILFIILLCLGTAWLTSEAGLSLALGAFIAGLVISESEFSHQVVADILPLRDSFSGIFFISIGMLLNLDFLADDAITPLLNLFLIVGIKSIVIFLVFWRFYRSVRLGVILGLSLAQIGEFSFILAKVGQNYGLLTSGGEQLFLAASILSMIATPFLIQWVHPLAFGLETTLLRPAGLAKDSSQGAEEVDDSMGHVIIIGYGLNGQNLARVLKEVGIPYRILEMDPALVGRARAAGEPIVFGDGTRPEVLETMGIEQARILVIAISDRAATAHIVSQARRLNRLGASQVIPEEFETSVEIFARVLQEIHVPRNVITLQVDLIRKEHYGTLRGMHLQGKRLDELSQFLVGTTTDTFLVQEGSPAIGNSLEGLDLRSRTGVTVIAAVRDGESIPNPGPNFLLSAGDILVLLGSHQALNQATQILSPPMRTEK
jgi:CPA2 family monovalent cation:H+ antiporter-2